METADPLDSEDFDPVTYVNQHFPTEASLKRLEPFLARVDSNITQLDSEISRAVQAQAEAGERAAKDISEAKGAIHELHHKIKDIKSKAEQSELMVQEICKDIKQLDYAKRHLQTTITALKRLHMLITAVDQLSLMAQDKRYRESAHLLEATSQLLTHFEPYAAVGRIKELKATVAAIKEALTEEILQAFTRVTLQPSELTDARAGAGEFKSLSEACLVVDALGPAAVERQVLAMVSDALQPYTTMPEFQRGGDAASLDQIERRFSWFRRVIREVENRFSGTFPAKWKVSHRICIQFLTVTRSHLLDVLTSGDPEVENVTVLLKALQKTLVFEKELQVKFENGVDEVSSAVAQLDESGQFVDPKSAAGIKRRHDLERERKNRTETATLAGRGAGSPASGDGNLPKIVAMLSSVYDPFMGPYISLERNNLEEMMTKYLDEEQVGSDGALPVYTSSVQMFGYIKGSIKRCTALTAGKTFFDLQTEFKASLQKYSSVLRGKIGAHSSEKELCYVVNTAEYAAETIPQLEELIKSKMEGAYASQVNLTPEQDGFYEVIAAAIRALVAGLEREVEPGFRAMASLNWGAVDAVGEESPFVRTINAAALKYIPNCRDVLSSLYFRNFCDKFAAAFCPAFLALLQKQRRISEEGTQQLLLDVYNLKKMMLELPRIGREPDDAEVPVPISYRKYVDKHMSKIERLLKLVGTPPGMLVEHFRMMWPEGGTKELQIVMALKGMRRQDQINALETFGGGASVLSEAEASEDLKARFGKGMKDGLDNFQKIGMGSMKAFRTGN